MNDLESEVAAFLESRIKVKFMGKNILNAKEVDTDTLNEDECCMRDFVLNDYGMLVQVNYDIVKDE